MEVAVAGTKGKGVKKGHKTDTRKDNIDTNKRKTRSTNKKGKYVTKIMRQIYFISSSGD